MNSEREIGGTRYRSRDFCPRTQKPFKRWKVNFHRYSDNSHSFWKMTVRREGRWVSSGGVAGGGRRLPPSEKVTPSICPGRGRRDALLVLASRTVKQIQLWRFSEGHLKREEPRFRFYVDQHDSEDSTSYIIREDFSNMHKPVERKLK